MKIRKKHLTIVKDGTLWFYDEIREKWLSSDSLTLSAGRKGRARNIFLKLANEQSSSSTAYRIPKNATITDISIQARNNHSSVLDIIKNTETISIFKIDDKEGDSDSINIDIDEGDLLRFYLNADEFVRDPMVLVSISWRRD